MLSEEEVSSCINALTRLEVLERVSAKDNEGELFRFKVRAGRVIGRIIGGEFGEPPEGSELVPWLSCILLQILLEEEDIVVPKEQFTGMAAVIMGFMSEGAAMRRLHLGYDRPVISHERAKKGRKQPFPS
jgi:hypothetical protein